MEPIDSADWDDARRHVERCAECQSFQRRRDEFDMHVGAICRDVPVPEDLASRILAALDTEGGIPTAQPGSLPASTVAGTVAVQTRERVAQRPRLRRRVLWMAAAAACVALAFGGVWHVAFRRTIDLDQLIAAGIGPDATQLALFAEGAAPPLPMSLNGRIVFSAPHQLASGRAAVYLFELPTSRSGIAIRGRLLAVPAAKLIRRPESNAFLGSPASYRVTGYCSTAWVEGDLAYVCLVEGGEDLLHRLKARTVAT